MFHFIYLKKQHEKLSSYDFMMFSFIYFNFRYLIDLLLIFSLTQAKN